MQALQITLTGLAASAPCSMTCVCLSCYKACAITKDCAKQQEQTTTGMVQVVVDTRRYMPAMHTICRVSWAPQTFTAGFDKPVLKNVAIHMLTYGQ